MISSRTDETPDEKIFGNKVPVQIERSDSGFSTNSCNQKLWPGGCLALSHLNLSRMILDPHTLTQLMLHEVAPGLRPADSGDNDIVDSCEPANIRLNFELRSTFRYEEPEANSQHPTVV
jgi:hypothetical protein